MPTVAVQLYSILFKFILKHRLQNRIQNQPDESNTFGVTSRPEETTEAANPVFNDGVATKDIHIDPLTSLSVRIFLPESALKSPETDSKNNSRVSVRASPKRYDLDNGSSTVDRNGNAKQYFRRNSYGNSVTPSAGDSKEELRRNSYGCSKDTESVSLISNNLSGGVYRGYSPSSAENCRKLPVMLQFHGGGWVSGSNDSVANDLFCRRLVKLCDIIVLAVGYRLAPENKYPAAFEDGLNVLNWLGKQANLFDCSKSMGSVRGSSSGTEFKRADSHRHIVDTFGASLVEPWLAAHADPSRCVLLGVSCGANIANYVARKAVDAGKLMDPVKVVAQVLMYPFFMGSVPTHSEKKLANSYFYDKPMCMLAWKLFLPEEEFILDHPAANPLVPGRGPPLKCMPPTLTVVAEHDWMRDRAIAYSEELRTVNVDAPVLDYKDAVHEFATLDMLLKTPQAQACAEDISIWVKKYISFRGHELSY